MKKVFFLASVLLLLSFSSCRKEADPYMYYGETMKLAYDSYAGQFDLIWKNINSGYVFWDIDPTPWDEVYDEFMPQFMELDRQVAQGKSVPDSILLNIYKSAMGGLSDHHMKVKIKNLHPAAGDTGLVLIRPGYIDMEKRPEYIESKDDALEHMKAFQEDIETAFDVEGDVEILEHQYVTFDLMANGLGKVEGVSYAFNLFRLPDGRLVPYLWQSLAVMTPVFEHSGQEDEAGQAAALLDRFFTLIATTPKEKLAGFILDNRSNSGGYQDDLDYLIGSYINEEVVMFQTRYKEGPGRLEYSVWTDYKQKPFAKYHRDITTENIPFIILIDITSISMGEIEPLCARNVLPTAFIMGERSFGATGPLQAALTDLNYGGSFGNSDLSSGHYIYTSDFEINSNGVNNEGIGIVPDVEVVRKKNGGSFKAALEVALKHLRDQR